jgi:hypothetical protein
MATKTLVFVPKTVAELGIQAVSPVVAFTGRLVTTVVNIDEDGDGKVEGSEILKAAQNIGFDAFAVFRGFNLGEVKAELKDLDPTERQQLIDVFAKEFDLSNDEAEYLIEDWIEWLNRGTVLISRTRAMTKKEVAA